MMPQVLNIFIYAQAYAQDFFILIFMKSLLVSRENHQKDEDNIFTSIHTAGPSLLHRQAKPAFHLMKDSPFPSLPASYLLKAQRIFWSFLSTNGQVFWKLVPARYHPDTYLLPLSALPYEGSSFWESSDDPVLSCLHTF